MYAKRVVEATKKALHRRDQPAGITLHGLLPGKNVEEMEELHE